MIRNLSENCKYTENAITQAECTENASATCPDGTAESKEDEDIGEKTGQTKKRYRSEKQNERTRQYKKKIRRAKKQMMREKKLAERNSNDDHMTDNSWSFKQQGPEIEGLRTRLLHKSGNKIEPNSIGKNKTQPIENPAEQLPQADEKTKSEKTGVDKKLPKEDLVEPTSVQVRPVINIATEAAVDEARHKDLILGDTADRQDFFGILSVYVHSSIHVDYDKDPVNPVVTTSPANDFEYVYFSMKDFGNE